MRIATGARLGGGLALALAATLASVERASATRILGVRLGHHPAFTRVVFDLDAPASYRVEGPVPGTPAELRLTVGARSESLRLDPPRWTRFVRAVRVDPLDGAARVRIDLTTEDLLVTEQVLARPPRIVLDVQRPEAVDFDAVRPEPAAPPAERAAAPPATVEPSPVEAPAPAATPPEPAPAPPEPVSPSPVEAPAASPAPTLAAPETPAPAAPSPPPEPSAVPVPASETPAVATAPEARPFRNVLVLAAVVLVLVGFWLALLHRSRRRAAKAAADARWHPPESRPVLPAPAAPAPPLHPPAPAATRPAPRATDDARRASEGALRAQLAAIERRLAGIEARLDDVLDWRERSSRSLEAQGEEMRVQRAALARVHRIVREMARPEDLLGQVGGSRRR